MRNVIVSLTSALELGGLAAIIGVAFVLGYRATHTFNFAVGQLMLVGGFCLGWLQAETDIPFPFALVAALSVPVVLSVTFYRLVLRRMLGASLFSTLVATIALAAILDGLAAMVFGPSTAYILHIPGLPDGVFHIGDVRVRWQLFLIALIGLAAATMVAAFLKFTDAGTRVRAVGQDPVLAAQGGVNVQRVQWVTWAVVGLLCGWAGMGYATTNSASTTMVGVALLAFPAILLGGLDSVTGAIVGGLLLGVVQGFTITYYGAEILDLVTYGLLMLVILIRPRGLFGTHQVVRA